MQSTPTTFQGLVDAIIGILNSFIPVLFAGVFLFVMWKVFDAWVLNADNETKREEAKGFVVIAIFVLVLMVSVWGVVGLVRQSLFGG